MSGSTIVFITGGNAGLGLEVVKSLCRSENEYHIIIGTRRVSNGEAAIKAVKEQYPDTSSTFEAIAADLESDDILHKAVETIEAKHGHLDVLLNNGGANFDGRLKSGELSLREAWNASWNTNVTGTQVLTTFAVPLLLKSSNPRLMFVTSGTSTLTETEDTSTAILRGINASPEKGWPKPQEFNPIAAYRSSKAGLNMMMRDWTRILGNDGVKVWCISPGFLATGFAGIDAEAQKKMGAIEPSIGADFIVNVIEGHRDQDVGKVIRKDMIQPW